MPDFDSQPSTVKAGPSVLVDGKMTLKAPLVLEGIRGNNLREGTTLQVVAERPDGGIEPLLWLYDYKPQFARTYFYSKPLTLPAGTTIAVYPVSAGTIALISAPPGHSAVLR